MINLVKIDEGTAFIKKDFDEETCIRVAVTDVETTGLDYRTDELIELAIVVVILDKDFIFCGIESKFNELQQPRHPITTQLTAIHGITNEDVAGKKIDRSRVLEILDDCQYIMCHNAGFDRNFIDKMFPTMANKQYICSYTQVNWEAHDRLLPNKNLISLAVSNGFYFKAHRALVDSLAVVELMNRTDSYREVIELANKKCIKVKWQLSFSQKDHAKSNGFTWDAPNKSWVKVMTETDFNETVSQVTVGKWVVLKRIGKLDTFKDD